MSKINTSDQDRPVRTVVGPTVYGIRGHRVRTAAEYELERKLALDHLAKLPVLTREDAYRLLGLDDGR